MDKAYSTNDEDFRYESPDEVLQALADDDRLSEGCVYYEIDTKQVSLTDYVRADLILESAANALYDDIGEVAENAFSAPKEAKDELNAAISAWVEKHMGAERYWKSVGKSRELVVTAADMAEYGDSKDASRG